MKTTNIRSFAIIAHIDHGKSTLADRIMELTDTVNSREAQPQLLDDLAVERDHGVTAKSRSVRNIYHATDGTDYEFNLIDTPGYVDFNYEVTKSLTASDGVILLVDATQGVQAQTVANLRIAQKLELPILPVINKIDRANAQVEMVEQQIRNLTPALQNAEIMRVSAKTGLGVPELLAAIVRDLPSPQGDADAPLKALVFDSQYDQFQGIIAHVRVMDGCLKKGAALALMAEHTQLTPNEVGIFAPQRIAVNQLNAGEVGYLISGIKDAHAIQVGDTITTQANGASTALPGYQKPQPMVYAGIYPTDDYQALLEALRKLALNDAALQVVPSTSDALGPGFRCGFLGIFHLQIIRERLHDEYGVEVLVTAPNVPYHVHLKDQSELVVDNPVRMPSFEQIEFIETPVVLATITTPNSELNDVMQLAAGHRGEFVDMDGDDTLVNLKYRMPLSEIAYDFFNRLKSVSHGYASITAESAGFEPADVVRVDVQINYAQIDALTFITYRSDAPRKTQTLVHKLKYVVPRRLEPMPAQAIVEGRVIARVDIPPLRKNAAVNGYFQEASVTTQTEHQQAQGGP